MANLPSVLTDGSWQDRAFISIIRKDDQEQADFAGLTDDFGWGDGQKDFDGQPISNGGRIRERTAEEDATVNGTIYPIGASVADYEEFARPRGLTEFFYESGDQNTDKTSVSEYVNDNTRNDYLYVVLYTDDPTVEKATDEVGEDYHAWRIIEDNVQFTDMTPDWSDQVLTMEYEGKRSARNPMGKPNHLEQDKVPGDEETLFEIGINEDKQFVKFDDVGEEVEVEFF